MRISDCNTGELGKTCVFERGEGREFEGVNSGVRGGGRKGCIIHPEGRDGDRRAFGGRRNMRRVVDWLEKLLVIVNV